SRPNIRFLPRRAPRADKCHPWSLTLWAPFGGRDEEEPKPALSVPTPTVLGCPGRLRGRQKHGRAETANVSMPAAGVLSGRRIYIEDIYPLVDGGSFAVKRIVNEPVEVWADIFRDGHVVLAADLLWRPEGAERWVRVPMQSRDNDRWAATFTPARVGRHLYAIEA